MDRPGLSVLTATLLLLPALTLAQLPSGACYTEDVTCELQDNNLVGILGEVSNLADCRQACADENTTSCDYYTFFGPSSYPFIDECLLYSSCETLDPCEDCYTEQLDCNNKFCTAPVEGALDDVDNIVRIIDDIEDERICDRNCQLEEACNIYTYHRPNSSFFPSTCYLLSSLGEPIRACENDTCSSGTPNCEGTLCTYLDDGYMSSSLVVKSSKKINLLRLGTCPTPLVVAVGGGGRAASGSYYGGGGSGYVDHVELRINQSYVQFMADVGSAGEETVVTDISGNTTYISADSGSQGSGGSTNGNGGRGYSGGGGGGAVGGSDGGDGEDGYGNGGTGSGTELSRIPIQSISLSPGRGGSGYSSYGGGGGGGVMVDSDEPVGGDSYDGAGYGRGGGNNNNPGSGVILFDLI